MRIRIWIQHFSSIQIRAQFRIRIRIHGFDDQKCKIFQLKKKFYLFISKNAIQFSLGLHKGRPSYRRSLERSIESIQHFKTWNFFIFLFLWVIFALLNSDPADKNQFKFIRIRIHKTDIKCRCFNFDHENLDLDMNQDSTSIRRFDESRSATLVYRNLHLISQNYQVGINLQNIKPITWFTSLLFSIP